MEVSLMPKRPPNRRLDRAGLWSTINGAIQGGWGPTLRMLVLVLTLGGILIALAVLGQPIPWTIVRLVLGQT